MGIASETENIPDHLVGMSSAAIGSMVKILDALGNEDAFSIFIYVEKGMFSSKVAIQELGLTQKRFYSRLKELIDVGLIEKNEGEYTYTTLGRVFSKVGYSLLEVLENKDQFELLERLRDNANLSSSEVNKITSVVSKGSTDVSGLFNLIFLSEKQKKVEVLSSYEKLVEKLVEEINASKDYIHLASRYIDNKVVDSIFQAMKRGVKSKGIIANENLENKFNKLELILSPSLILSMLQYFSDPEIGDSMRDGHVPFSFCIIDGQRCFFELPSVGNRDFAIAFFVEDNEIGARFTKIFNSVWEMSEAKAIPRFLQMLNNKKDDS
jgi:predicted transcriptional regulator